MSEDSPISFTFYECVMKGDSLAFTSHLHSCLKEAAPEEYGSGRLLNTRKKSDGGPELITFPLKIPPRSVS